MIQSLLVKNYAIIEALKLDFSQGLTIITGETGAGKSILLGALGLVMGRRADNKSLFLKDKKCIIEAEFEVAKYGLEEFFEKEGLDFENPLILRREISPTGKSRAFVNDTPVNLKLLQLLSGALLDLHQQFDTMDIHQVSFQLRMIDALADNRKLLAKYQTTFSNYQEQRQKLQNLIERQETSAREIEFLQFQLAEFSEADPQPNEIESLESERKSLTNAEEIQRSLGAAYNLMMDADNAVVGMIDELAHKINQVRNLHPDLDGLSARFQSVKMEVEDIAGSFDKIVSKTNHDPERIQEIGQRLDALFKLQHKHRAQNTQDLLEIRDKMTNELNGFGDLQSEIDSITKDLTVLEKSLWASSKVLSDRRKKQLKPFSKKVVAMLQQLGMEYAQIKIEQSPLKELGSTGADLITFLFAPNKGSEYSPIKEVASGGELSRLTLAIKSLVADAIPLPTLIFDEIDTGISGDVALKMGHILSELAERHQVVSITHTPQIAVQADRHYFVYKKPEKNSTITNVKLLNEVERIEEVATMLSGSPPSASAIENAKELLGV